MQKILIPTIVAASLLLAACSPHKINIQQGNVITARMYKQLKVGMTQKQVLFLMGTPMLRDPFHRDRWDYAYSYTPGGGKTTRYHVTLFFKGGQLARITKQGTLPTTDLPVKLPPASTNLPIDRDPSGRGGDGDAS